MVKENMVREVMIPLTDYPPIPYWFSVRQAIAMVKAAAGMFKEFTKGLVIKGVA